jgi:hypothetical protein
MAHFAKINNDLVEQVVVVDNNDILVDGVEHEETGALMLNQGFGGNWVQTSYNTNRGVHSLGGTPFRKNYAGRGHTYDATRDAFIPPQPYPSFILNEDTCDWEAPVAFPDDEDEKSYRWDEATTNWVEVE